MRYEPRFVLLPFVWAAGVAVLWLTLGDAWIWPVRLAQLISPVRVGPHCGVLVRDTATAAGTVLLTLFTAFGMGATLLARWLSEKNLFSGLITLAVGLWGLSVVVLLTGLFSIAAVPWVYVLGFCWLLPWPRQFFSRRCVRAVPTAWETLVICFLALAATLNFIGALVPPFEYDELEYHLGALAEYRRAGRIIFLPHNFYSNLPQLTEMLYLLGSDTAAKLLHWSFGVLSAVAVYAVAERMATRRVALTAAALFYCLPFVQNLSMTARVDLATTFFAALAFGGLLLDEVRWSALAAGCALATKWTAVPVVLLPCLLFVWASHTRRPLLARYAGLAIGFVAPWLLKNELLAGNAVYPLWSHAASWSAEQAALFAWKHYPRFDGDGLWQLVERIWRYSFIETDASPLLLLAAPLVLFCRNRTKGLRRAVGLFLSAYVAWYLFTFRPWRFLFPAFPLAAILGGWALCETRWTRAVAALVMTVGLSMMSVTLLADVGEAGTNPFHYALGNLSRRDFVAKMGGGCFEPIVWMNENLPPTATVLYLGEARTYHARHRVIWSTAYDRFPPHVLDTVTHVYVNFSELKRLHEGYGYPRGLDREVVLARCGREIHRTERGTVLEWMP